MQETVMKTISIMKKAQYMKDQYNQAIGWINSELSQELEFEKSLKLKNIKSQIESNIQSIDKDLQALESKLSELGMGHIWEVSKIISSV